MVNLWFFSLLTCTSVGLKVNAGKNNSANFIALSGDFGNNGSSAPTPSFTMIVPEEVMDTKARFGRKYSKSACKKQPG